MKERNQKLFILLKAAIAFYLLIFSINYMIAGTDAAFFSKGKVGVSIAAGEWMSILEFYQDGNNGNQNLKMCPENMTVKIRNISNVDMTEPAKYEVYYVENGNPEQEKGTKYGEGTIPALKAGERIELTFETADLGFYKFSTYKEPGNSKSEVIWSKKIKVNCKQNKKLETQNETVENEENADTQSVEENVTPQNEQEKSQGNTKVVEENIKQEEPSQETTENTQPQEQATEESDTSVPEKMTENNPNGDTAN